jgi:LAS superfamily LD-carboxypeptidase LdcB
MNIVGENFPKEIVDQINLRQTKLGSSHRDNELLSWMNSKTGWVRLVSSVDVNKEINPRKILDKLRGDGESALAEQYVLFGGVTKYTPNATEGATIKQRSGIERDGLVHNMGAYGLGGLDYGLSPMPGIVSANIKTENRGSLRTSTIVIKAYNRKQFDIIDLLYLRLGYTVLLEWGHSMFYDNNGKLKNDVDANGNATFGQATLESLFLTGKDKTGALINYNSLLPIIDKRRKQFFGNYDAVLGKVVNYSWTVNKDLSYDITLTVRSVGDVIESLKMNTSLGGTINTNTTEDNTTQSSTTPKTDKETIEAFKNKNTMAEYFYSFIEKGKTGRDIRFLSFKNGESNSDDKIYYIRLGHLLDWIQNNIIPNIRNKNGSTSNGKIIKINTDSKTNVIHLEQRQIITDPRICVFNTTIVNPLFGLNIDNFLNNSQPSATSPFTSNDIFNKALIQAASETGFSVPICSDFEEGEFLENDNRYLYLMNTYFSMSWILNKMDTIEDDEGNVLLLDFLQSLCNGFEEATCYYNKLTPTVNDIGEITFIDEIGLPDRDNILTKPDFKDQAVQTVGDGENLAKFNMFGYKESGGQASFIRDFSFRTEIPASFATMITVGAQARGLVVGEDATCLSKMNYGLTDRMKPEIIDADIDSTVSEDQKLISKFLEKTNPIISVVFGFLDTTYQQNILDPKVIDSIKSIGKDIVKLNKTITSIIQAIKKESPTSSPGSGFIPFNLQLTMDGLSGFKIYQKYTAEQEFLPTNYPESLDFIIKGITHTIQNNQWTTTIESFGMPKITKGSGHISTPPQPQTATSTSTSTNTGAARKIRAIEGKNYTNGEIPENLLRPINNMAKYKGAITSDGGRIRLYEKASIALDKLIVAAEQAKIPVKINSGYRTYDDQVKTKRDYGKLAATPGTSNHGFGIAVDFATPGLKRIKPGDKLYDWLAAGNGAKFGFKRIASETWHWEYQQT